MIKTVNDISNEKQITNRNTYDMIFYISIHLSSNGIIEWNALAKEGKR